MITIFKHYNDKVKLTLVWWEEKDIKGSQYGFSKGQNPSSFISKIYQIFSPLFKS
jgi:hypothetical protein